MLWSLWFYTYYTYLCLCTHRQSPDRDTGEKETWAFTLLDQRIIELRKPGFYFQEIALLARASELSELLHYAPLVFLFFFLALSSPVLVFFNILHAELCPCMFFPSLFFISYPYAKPAQQRCFLQKGKAGRFEERSWALLPFSSPLPVQETKSRWSADTRTVWAGHFVKNKTVKLLWPPRS